MTTTVTIVYLQKITNANFEELFSRLPAWLWLNDSGRVAADDRMRPTKAIATINVDKG